MLVWLGGNIRNNMWFGKQLISATNGIHSPFRWRTFRQDTQAHCQWCPSWPVREHRLLHSDTAGLTVDIPGTKNASRLEAAIPLAIEVAAWPGNVNKPIPCETMVAKDWLLAEGGLSETKVILGWLFNLRTLTVSLPDHKFIAWTAAIQKNDHIKTHHIERPRHDHQTNGTCGFRDSMGLPLPQSTPFPALPQQKSTIYNSQRHMHERFGVEERDSGKIKRWNRYELTHIPSTLPHILFRFVPSRAWGIQQPRAHMVFSCPSPI